MVVILVEPAGALLQRSLELRGNTLEPYSCEVIATYSAEMLGKMGCSVRLACCVDEDQDLDPKSFGAKGGKEVRIHVLQHGRKAVEDQELAAAIFDLLAEGSAPYVVGLSVRTYAYIKSLVLAAILKSKNADVKIVFGGYHPSVSCGELTKTLWEKANSKDFLRPVDYQVVGEGEKPFTALLGKLLQLDDDLIKNTLRLTSVDPAQWDKLALQARAASQEPTIIGGKAWRLNQKEFEQTPQPIRNPFLIGNWCRNWNLSYPSPRNQTGVFQVQFTRGCSHSACRFCCTPHVFGGADEVRHKTPEALVAQIDEVRRQSTQLKLRPPNFAYFNDVTFNAAGDEWRRLCKSFILSQVHSPHPVKGNRAVVFSGNDSARTLDEWLKASGDKLAADESLALDIPVDENIEKNLHWFALCRGDAISIGDALLLSSAGCSKVGIGIESFSNDVAGSAGLRKHKVDATLSYVDSIATTLKSTDQVGIINRIYIILGSPADTIESLKATWEMLRKLPVDQIRVAFYVPYVTDDSLLVGIERTALSEDRPNIAVPALAAQVSALAQQPATAPSQEDPFAPAVEAARSLGANADEQVRAFLKRFRSELIKAFYRSDFYRKRVSEKLARYPHLEESYREFFVELFETSAGDIDIRDNLKIK